MFAVRLSSESRSAAALPSALLGEKQSRGATATRSITQDLPPSQALSVPESLFFRGVQCPHAFSGQNVFLSAKSFLLRRQAENRVSTGSLMGVLPLSSHRHMCSFRTPLSERLLSPAVREAPSERRRDKRVPGAHRKWNRGAVTEEVVLFYSWRKASMGSRRAAEAAG